jgi:hypothetical protein
MNTEMINSIAILVLAISHFGTAVNVYLLSRRVRKLDGSEDAREKPRVSARIWGL